MVAQVDLCPLCSGIRFNSTGAEISDFTVKLGLREFQQPVYAVRECSTCGLLYKNRTAAPAELDEYYAQVDFRKWEIRGHFPTERTVLDVLQRMPKGSCLLDFGCSSGRLLAPLTRDYDCWGLEINSAAAAVASAKGIKMLSPECLEGAESEPFDAVLLVDVFEHPRAPLALLRELHRLLKPGALLLVVPLRRAIAHAH